MQRCQLFALPVWVALSLGLCAGPAYALREYPVQLADLQLRILDDYPNDERSTFNTFTVGIEVDNAGPERALRLALSGPVSATEVIRVPAGQTTRHFMHLPIQPGYHFEHRTLHIQDSASQQGLQETLTAVAPSYRPVVAQLGSLLGVLNLGSDLENAGDLSPFWPDSARALSGISGIVADYGSLRASPERHRLLLNWVVQGGALFIHTPARHFGDQGLLPGSELFETGPLRFTSCQGSQACAEHRKIGDLHEVDQRFGYGLVRYASPELMTSIAPEELSRLSLWSPTSVELNHFDTLAKLLGEDVVPRSQPTLPLFGILLAFSMIGGPLGYFLFIRRRSRPFGYVATVAFSSLGCSLLLLVADAVQYGLWPQGKGSALLFIDQVAGRELGLRDCVAVAPSGLGRELQAPRRTEILLGWQADRAAAPMQATFSEDMTLISSGLEQRTPSVVGSRWVAPARGRLVVNDENGQLRVENHLGLELQSLWLWHAGKRYFAASLAPGATAELSSAGPEVSLAELSAELGPLVQRGTQLLERAFQGELREHRYLAVSAQPLGPPLLPQMRVAKQGARLIFGVLP